MRGSEKRHGFLKKRPDGNEKKQQRNQKRNRKKRERGTGILDYKKGTRYLKSSGILLREQSVDPASLYAAASAVAGMFGLSKKEELAERFCRAAYDGA